MVRIKKPAVILCDIEGTTTSTRFWHEILAPFIKEHLGPCLRDKWKQPETVDVVTLLRNKTNEDINNGDQELPPIAPETATTEEIINSILQNVYFQMQQRRQSNELKSLHLLVWLYGYQNELLKGHVYSDVMSAFRKWKLELGIKIYTFATSDVIVQKMLFACSLYGNLIPFIDGYFNYETVGKKTDSESFKTISKLLQVPCNQIIFLSDNLLELKSCQAVGITPILVIRSHNHDLLETSIPYKYIKSFEELEFY